MERVIASKVTDMSEMFFFDGGHDEFGPDEFAVNLTNWDTSKVTNMSECFIILVIVQILGV